MSDFSDAIIREWGDRIYSKRTRGKKARKHTGLKPVYHPKNSSPKKVNYRKILSRISTKAPEVMVKISGSGKGMRSISAHMSYISRNGNVEVEDEKGNVYIGKNALEKVKEDWEGRGYNIPQESTKRESFNIVLSMPPNTNRIAVKNAAREFACQEFVDQTYVFAAHDDQDHPHVHICVKAVSDYGVRLNPRKADLERWREGFAQKMRENGIDCNATPRRIRAVVRTPEKQALLHMKEKRGGAIDKNNEQHKQNKFNDMEKSQYREMMLKGYEMLSHTLKKGTNDDIKLAHSIDGFLRDITKKDLSREIIKDERKVVKTQGLSR